MKKVNSTLGKKNKKINFFEKSVELDKIVFKNLSSVLLNDLKSFDNKNDNYYFAENEICEKNIENNFQKTDIKKISEIFSKVNKERIFFRNLLKKLFKKKFWQIRLKKKSSNLFVNKISGINNEIFSKRIENLEKESETLKNIIKDNITKIEHLVNLNEELTFEVGKTKIELKNFIMKENVDERNSLRKIKKNSSNSIFNTNNLSVIENRIPLKKSNTKTHFYQKTKPKQKNLEDNFNLSISDFSNKKSNKKYKRKSRIFRTRTLNKIL